MSPAPPSLVQSLLTELLPKGDHRLSPGDMLNPNRQSLGQGIPGSPAVETGKSGQPPVYRCKPQCFILSKIAVRENRASTPTPQGEKPVMERPSSWVGGAQPPQWDSGLSGKGGGLLVVGGGGEGGSRDPHPGLESHP